VTVAVLTLAPWASLKNPRNQGKYLDNTYPLKILRLQAGTYPSGAPYIALFLSF
jgi:hypothetical protein